MRKKSLKLVKSILAEAVGDPQTASHTWDIPHPHDAWKKLSPKQQATVQSLDQQGRLHPDGHLHGWKPGTGPVFGRDFHGRSNEDYINLHKRYKQELMDSEFGYNAKTAHARAAQYVAEDRSKAHHAGLVAHEEAMRPIREAQKKQRQSERQQQHNQRQAAQNISGANQQQQYREHSEKLFQSAMQGAANSSDYYRTGAAHEREHEKQSGYINLDVRHPQLSDEAKKHLGALTDFSRTAIHSGVWGGLQSAGKEFSKDAMEHWNKTFTGMRPHEANINHPLDIIPSLLKPEHLSAVLNRYSTHYSTHPHHGIKSEHSNMSIFQPPDDKDRRPGLPIDTGSNMTHQFRTNIPDSIHTFHRSVSGLGHFGTSIKYKDDPYHHVSDGIRSHIARSLKPLYMGGESPFKTSDNDWEKQVAYNGEEQHNANFRKAIGAGLKHIWSIPNISDHDRVLLHRHFESQLRHHYVAAVANPKMFNQYHQSMETSRRERDNASRESAGGSSSGKSTGGSSSSARPYNQQEWEAKWREAQAKGPEEGKRFAAEWRRVSSRHRSEIKEQERMTRPKAIQILGLSENPTKHEIKAAHRRLSIQHHPDQGGDEATYKAVQSAHDYFKDLNEWVEMLAEWVSKRYKK